MSHSYSAFQDGAGISAHWLHGAIVKTTGGVIIIVSIFILAAMIGHLEQGKLQSLLQVVFNTIVLITIASIILQIIISM